MTENQKQELQQLVTQLHTIYDKVVEAKKNIESSIGDEEEPTSEQWQNIMSLNDASDTLASTVASIEECYKTPEKVDIKNQKP